jgi:translation initiation factor IF-2
MDGEFLPSPLAASRLTHHNIAGGVHTAPLSDRGSASFRHRHADDAVFQKVGPFMVKVRVHELAKKLGLENKELIEKLNKAGIDIKSHSSAVEEADAMKLLNASQPKQPAPSVRSTVVRRSAPTPEVEVVHVPEPEQRPVLLRPTASQAVVVRGPIRLPEPVAAPAVAPAIRVAVEAPAAREPVQAPAVVIAAPPAAAEPVAGPTAAVQAVATPKAPVVDDVPRAAPLPAAPPQAPAAPAAPGAQNITRVIDADTIRARLAGEGRVLGPSGPRRAGPPGRGPIREVRVINDRFAGPTMVDVTSGAAPGALGAPGAPGARRDGDRGRGRAQGGRDMWFNPGEKRRTGKKGKQTEVTQAAAHKRVVEMDDLISVADLAHQMAIKSGQVISKLFSMGMMVTVNQTIDLDTASLIAQEFGFEVKNVAFTEENLLDEKIASLEKGTLAPRAPVVTIMGHVDHGKTSLLDRIRNANVASGEAGGITQHIGAYQVETPNGRITFLDTPGHAAFSSMRARGAQVTDIVILVCAADDGVMPQTVEALKHAQAAKVPIIVALNKADKPGAKPERVMQQFTEYGLVSEEWGGENIMLPVSAHTGLNIDKLLESVLLVAEVADLKAAPDRKAEGTVIEAELDKGRGPVATILIQEGTLKIGDYIVAGEHAGRVRAMIDDRGHQVKEAGPSMPVQVLGLSGVPDAGDRLNAVVDEKNARAVAEHRAQKGREESLKRQNQNSMSNLLDFIGKSASAEQQLDLKVVVKADVGGSCEAVSQALEKLSTKKVRVSVIQSGVGTITESDVNFAMSSKAMVVGFNSKPDAKAAQVASHEKVEVRSYSIIYELLDDVRKVMSQMLAPNVEERYLGKAEVRQVFSVPKLGAIAGSYVLDGKIVRNERARLKRGNTILHEGTFASLKRFKDDAKDVAAGFECGIGFVSFNAMEPGDIIECFELVEVAADLGEAIDPLAAAMSGGKPSSGAEA